MPDDLTCTQDNEFQTSPGTLRTSTNAPTRKLPELLAPAGGFEQLRYALYFGADAVYLACDKFGLRQRAQNFSLEDMPRAVEMAHEAGAKVYVTLNAYLHDEDFADLPAYLRALEAAGVDAVIVSDLGVLAAARKHAPSVDIHVSTQASVSNAAAARMWHELGAKRIVTAREMSLEEIAALKRELPEVELEVFVQGAMCMAISGRCLISDFLTGRSANQGHCVQPCRWSYRLEENRGQGTFPQVDAQQPPNPAQPANQATSPTSTHPAQPANQDPVLPANSDLAKPACTQPAQPVNFVLEEPTRPGEYFPVEEDENGTYLMNSKDLNMLAHVDDLVAAGVDSIKIEGRVKKAFYVATVVNAYRHVLDGEDPKRWESELDRISHRPYSTGFFYGGAEQSFDDDIYVQRYDWVAEVIASQPIANDANDTNARGANDANARGANDANACAAIDMSACDINIQETNDARAHGVNEPGKPNRTSATCEDGTINQASGQQWRTLVYCRNRFYEGDTLELLSPHHEVVAIPVVGLEEVFLEQSDEAAQSRVLSNSQSRLLLQDDLSIKILNTVSADTANKAMGVYAFVTSMPLHQYDMLRAKRHDPSRKN